MEQWKPIPGYESLYEASCSGNIRSLIKGKVKKLRHDSGKNYLLVELFKDKKPKTFLVHRLIASTFYPCSNSHLLQVNHKDGNKTNNNISNLEWVTQSQNIKHSYDVLGHIKYAAGKFGILNKKAIPIQQIDRNNGNVIRIFHGAMEVQRELNFDQSSIHKCCKGKIKHFRGYLWKYAV